ncbi:hypothetical protein V491_02488, partial [Pseudogymnoascus sp. VKM F-3775]
LPPLKSRLPTTQPLSLKPAQFRKTQLLRQYASLLRSTPLLILFQHNNLNTAEWTSLRRELAAALAKVDAELALAGEAVPSGSAVKLQIVQTGIFAAALRVVEYFDPSTVGEGEAKHTLSKAAHAAVEGTRTAHGFAPLLSGPYKEASDARDLAYTFLKIIVAAHGLPDEIISDRDKLFTSKFWQSLMAEPSASKGCADGVGASGANTGLQKLQLLGARVEGKVFDMEGARWVGMIPGGLEGLRAQVVHLLQSAGAGVTNALESAGKSLFFTVEGRRMMLEEEEKGPEAKEEAKDEVKAE